MSKLRKASERLLNALPSAFAISLAAAGGSKVVEPRDVAELLHADASALLGEWVLEKPLSESLDAHLQLMKIGGIKRKLMERSVPVTSFETLSDAETEALDETENVAAHNGARRLRIVSKALSVAVETVCPASGETVCYDTQTRRYWEVLSYWHETHRCFVQYRETADLPALIELRFTFRSAAILDLLGVPHNIAQGKICLLKWISFDEASQNFVVAHRWVRELAPGER